jgi:hypothetical protein
MYVVQVTRSFDGTRILTVACFTAVKCVNCVKCVKYVYGV